MARNITVQTEEITDFPAGWWLLPSVALGTGFWVWLAFTLI